MRKLLYQMIKQIKNIFSLLLRILKIVQVLSSILPEQKKNSLVT